RAGNRPMSAKPFLLIAGLVATVATAAWHDARVIRITRISLVDIAAQRGRVEAAIRAAEQHLAAAEIECARLQSKVDAAHRDGSGMRSPAAVDTQPSAQTFTNPFLRIHDD